MPVPIFALAWPVLHSSGAWIASTSAAGYVSGTLASSWTAAFVLGNSKLLSAFGIVSTAGLMTAGGGLAAVATGAAVGVGGWLSSIGLGGLAAFLGIAPPATFLGLTLLGWVTVGSSTLAAALAVLCLWVWSRWRKMNQERVKGHLPKISLRELVAELRLFEKTSMLALLERISSERKEVEVNHTEETLCVGPTSYPISRLRFVVTKKGEEMILVRSWLGRRRTLLTL